MTDPPKYFDPRSDLWRRAFDLGKPYEAYLAASPADKADRWREMAGQVPELTDGQVERLTGFNRTLNVIALSGVWCGDCVRQGPMLDRLARAAGAELRWLERDELPEFRDEVRIAGAMRVPSVVFCTEDFWSLGRFGDRMLTAYLRKAANEMGAACPVPYAAPPEGDLAAEQGEWLDIFERMLLMARLSPPLRARHGD